MVVNNPNRPAVVPFTRLPVGAEFEFRGTRFVKVRSGTLTYSGNGPGTQLSMNCVGLTGDMKGHAHYLPLQTPVRALESQIAA